MRPPSRARRPFRDPSPARRSARGGSPCRRASVRFVALEPQVRVDRLVDVVRRVVGSGEPAEQKGDRVREALPRGLAVPPAIRVHRVAEDALLQFVDALAVLLHVRDVRRLHRYELVGVGDLADGPVLRGGVLDLRDLLRGFLLCGDGGVTRRGVDGRIPDRGAAVHRRGREARPESRGFLQRHGRRANDRLRPVRPLRPERRRWRVDDATEDLRCDPGRELPTGKGRPDKRHVQEIRRRRQRVRDLADHPPGSAKPRLTRRSHVLRPPRDVHLRREALRKVAERGARLEVRDRLHPGVVGLDRDPLFSLRGDRLLHTGGRHVRRPADRRPHRVVRVVNKAAVREPLHVVAVRIRLRDVGRLFRLPLDPGEGGVGQATLRDRDRRAVGARDPQTVVVLVNLLERHQRPPAIAWRRGRARRSASTNAAAASGAFGCSMIDRGKTTSPGEAIIAIRSFRGESPCTGARPGTRPRG